MLTYNIDDRGNTPIYEFLYNCIKEDIISGRIGCGERLPSKREMATRHGIALITVENAYEQLLMEGYVEAEARKGYYACEIVRAPKEHGSDLSKQSDTSLPSKSFNSAISSKGLHISSKEQAIQNTENTIIADFTAGHIQADSFPYATWTKLLRRVISDKEDSFAGTPTPEGIVELRSAIAGYLLNAKGLDIDPGRIIVGPGTEYLHSILLQLVGRNRIVAVEDPGYKKVGLIYESNGMKVLHIPVDGEGMVVDKLTDSNASLVHVSPSHHFPTGTVLPASRRHKLISWAAKQDAYIIEDDYDSEFRFRGRPFATLSSLDSEHVIYMNTFTGSLAPSIRIAYMVLPPKLMDIFHEKLYFLSGTVSTFEQLTLAAFMNEGYYERHINRMRNQYKKLRNTYLKAISESKLSEYACIEDDSAGIHMVLRINRNIDSRRFVQNNSRAGISMKAITDYCYGAGGYQNRFIIRYIDITYDELIKIFDIIADNIIDSLF